MRQDRTRSYRTGWDEQVRGKRTGRTIWIIVVRKRTELEQNGMGRAGLDERDTMGRDGAARAGM